MRFPNKSENQESGFHVTEKSNQSLMIQFLMRIGHLESVVLITLFSVAASALITLICFSFLSPSVYTSSAFLWGLSIFSPLIIAPFMSFSLMQLIFELEAARKLAFSLSIHDGMTGIYNRRHFMAMADSEFAKAIRYDLPLSIIMIDADHFKQINDSFGHKAGDGVLQAITKSIQSCLRSGDILARYGGEEFVLLMPYTDHKGALEVGERIRHAIASKPVLCDGGVSIPVTVSMGISAMSRDIVSVEELLKRSDLALYRAKDNGRNQVQSVQL